MIKNVFIIGIDGLGRGVFKYDSCKNIKKLAQKSTVYLNGVSVCPSISAQAWGSMFLSVSPEKHGYTNDFVSKNKHKIGDDFPSLFNIISQNKADFSLASFCNWDPINFGILEDIEDMVKFTGNDDETTNSAADYIRQSGNGMVFVHLDDVDAAGHEYDYFTKEFYEQLTTTDINVGIILDAINESGKGDDSLIILVSDHGGGYIPKEHGSSNIKDMGIFVMVCGGTAQQDLLSMDEVSIMDITPFILNNLGIDVPSHMQGDHTSLNSHC